MESSRNPSGPAGPGLLPVTVEGTRGVILRQSLALFAERGYGATTVRDIAERVGILSGSLYSHFPSKEDILAELVEMGMAAHHDGLRAVLLSSPPEPLGQLTALMRTHVAFHARYALLATVLHAEMHILSPGKAERAQRLRYQAAQLFRDVVQRGMELEVFEVADLEVAIMAIGSIGLRVAFWYTPAFHLDIETLAEQMAELARRIVGAGHAAA